MNRIHSLFCFSLVFSFHLMAQDTSSKQLFSSPLRLPYSFSGNFGELRPAHLHSGLDFRTGGRIGIPVYAVEEGYISRVSVSGTGYGNALYIAHPDGTTTVYGHLSRFAPKLAAFVKDKQYYTESFQINVTLLPHEWEVTKGELIAWSGNTGNSGGPHLHFEVRDTQSENAVNPLFFLTGIQDHSAPSLISLYIYPLSGNSHVNRTATKKRFPTVKVKNGYTIPNDSQIEGYGKIGFGIQATDDFNGTGIKCGIYSTSLLFDGKTVFGFKMDRFAFDQTRYANSQMDYQEQLSNKRKVYRLYRQPGNELEIYHPLVNDGILDLEDGKIHTIEIILSDAFHNRSVLKFKIFSRKYSVPEVRSASSVLFSYEKENTFKNKDLKLVIPKGALYNDFSFFYGERPQRKGCYSKIQEIHDPGVPLQKPMQISIKAEDLPDELKDKSLLVRFNNDGQRQSVGGEFSAGWVSTASYEFGSYAVSVDTIGPVIVPLSIGNNKKTPGDQILFRIGDNLSGVKMFRGEIDDRWVLFEYNPKTGLITHFFDKTKTEMGKNHLLKLTVVDNKQNKTEYKATFFK